MAKHTTKVRISTTLHKTTPHFLEWREIANKLTVSRTTTRLESL